LKELRFSEIQKKKFFFKIVISTKMCLEQQKMCWDKKFTFFGKKREKSTKFLKNQDFLKIMEGTQIHRSSSFFVVGQHLGYQNISKVFILFIYIWRLILCLFPIEIWLKWWMKCQKSNDVSFTPPKKTKQTNLKKKLLSDKTWNKIVQHVFFTSRANKKPKSYSILKFSVKV